MGLVSSKWPKPSDYKTREELVIPYTEAYGYAKAVTDLIAILENAGERAKKLRADGYKEKNTYDFE